MEVGKLADLVVLSEDPTAVDPETLADIKVVETIKEGQSVYQASPQLQKKTDMTWPGGTQAAFEDTMKEIFVEHRLGRLPEAYRTGAMRARIASDFEDCLAGVALSEIMVPDAGGEAMAAQ